MNIITEIENFITQTKDAREVKRALAVKMILQGQHYLKIQEILQVSQQFISKWKNIAIFDGVHSLKVKYQGRKNYLTSQEKKEMIHWLREQDYLRLWDLKKYVQEKYNVIFSSEQSYYDIFKEAKISWKKTQKKTH